MSRNGITRRGVLRGTAAVGLLGVVGTPSVSAQEVDMTIASAFEPGHINVEASEMFAEAIAEETDGDVGVEVVPGGAYGAEDEIGELVAERGVEAHAAGTFPYFQYSPDYWFFGNPFVMEDYDHLLRVMDSELMEGGFEAMRENGNQRPIGQQIYRGLRHFTSNDPIQSPEDVEGLNLRLPELDPWVQIWSEIGVDPTPIALDELYTALETGTADASEGDTEQISAFNLFEVQDYLSMTGHLIETGNIYVNEDFFQELDEAHQDAFLEVGEEVTAEAAEIAIDREEDLIDELADEGMGIVDDVDRDAFFDAGAPAVESLFEDQWVGTWDEVLEFTDEPDDEVDDEVDDDEVDDEVDDDEEMNDDDEEPGLNVLDEIRSM